jgi:PHD/YefM family antitoxin component YafN of YafNO toxin-antitoxin module
MKSDNQPIFITRHGHTEAVLLSTSEYEALTRQAHQAQSSEWYEVAQASLARVWEHPDEDVYTWEDGEPV